MKNKAIGLMINPFTRVAGWQAFSLGLVFIILMGIIGTYSNVSFDGGTGRAVPQIPARTLRTIKSFGPQTGMGLSCNSTF